MAKWSGNKVNPGQINNGNEYTVNDNVSIEELNGIVNNSLKAQEDAERALELATGANEANGTVVKINGEPQGTWDATFSQELYEESANELDFTDVKESTYRGLTYSFKDNVLTLNGTTEGIVDRIFYLNSQINANGNYVFSGNNSNISVGSYFTLSTGKDTPLQLNSTVNKSDKANVSNLSITSLHMYLDGGVTYNNFKISFSLIKGDLEGYQPYNPNRHITNSEAEFLKEEFGKNYNLVNPSETTKDFIDASGNLASGGETAKFLLIKCEAKTIYLKAKSNIGTPNARVTEYNSSGTFIKRTLINATDIVAGTSYVPSSSAYTLDIRTNDTTDSKFEDFIISYSKEALSNYQPYNSASHITNTQADLLKSEYEKQKNILDITNFKGQTNNGFVNTINADGSVNSSGTLEKIWANIFAMSNYKLEAGTYTFSINQIFEISVVLKVTRADGSTYDYTINAGKTSTKFTSSQDITKISIFYNHGTIGNTYNINGLKFQLEKGDKATSIQDFNGEIIHEKDIKQVLLWENGSPNVKFTTQTITTLDMSKYKHLIFAYKSYATGGYIMYEKVDYVADINIALSYLFYASGTTYSRIRRLKITNTTSITFESAYSSNTLDDLVVVPIAIYGVNY